MKTQDFKSDITRCFLRNLGFIWAVLAVALLLSPPVGHAQTFESGSDGSDGALNLTTPGTIDFDPGALGLDADGDHIFHFTTITIAEGVTVRLSAAQINGPVFWLASGDVQIDGTINVNGENGQSDQDVINESRRFAVPGAGGFAGGLGSTVNAAATPGFGPGGSGITSGRSGGGAGHAVKGSTGTFSSPGGDAYGNDFLVPLVGGSGAGGGFQVSNIGAGGGAGGGALLVASSTSITINGTIQADGGSGGSPFPSGGGGSGGAIHLLAPSISVAGALSARGGSGGTFQGGAGSKGRIRVEAFQRTITGSVNPLPVTATPFAVFLPATPASLRVVSVDGVPVPPNPTGSFTMPDVTINDVSPVDVVIEARNIPVGTVVQLHLLSDAGVIQIVDSPPLAGTDALSTATASVTFPSGFSRGFVRATFGPPSP